MNKYVSEKIKVISFFSMIMVVFLHSINTVVNFKTETLVISSGISSFIQNFITNGITRIAVPMFFFISGFLFFLNLDFSIQSFLTKYKKRVKTLVIPYLFWSLFGLLVFFILQHLPYSENFFRNEPVSSYSLPKLLNTIFFNPVPYQLWFLKTLIVLILLSPLLLFFIRKLKWGWIFLLSILWFIKIPYPQPVFSEEFGAGLLFFSLGGLLSLNPDYYLKNDYSKASKFTLVVWLALVLLYTILLKFPVDPALIEMVQKISILLGMFTTWYLYDALFQQKEISNKDRLQLFSLSFFIFAFHEPVLTTLKKGLFFIMGRTELTSLTIYFLAPIITIFLSIVIGMILKKKAAPFYLLITGGR